MWVVFCVCRVGLMKLRPRVGCGSCVSCGFNEGPSSCRLRDVWSCGFNEGASLCGSCGSCGFNESAPSVLTLCVKVCLFFLCLIVPFKFICRASSCGKLPGSFV